MIFHESLIEQMSKVSAYIIAYNEQDKIKQAVQSVLWADEIIVIDSFSEDDTVKIAESLGARIVQVEFKGFGELRNQAIKACQYEWIFSLDSDERCTPEARDEILSIVMSADIEHDIYFMPRRNFFMGRWIKHSGWYPNYRQPQLFRKISMSYTLEPVHEGFKSHSKRSIGHLRNPIWQLPFKNVAEMMAKANRYSTLGALKLKGRGKKASFFSALTSATWAFWKHYLIKKGFLDGWPGFVIALGNFYGTFFRYVKYCENVSDWKIPPSKALHRKQK